MSAPKIPPTTPDGLYWYMVPGKDPGPVLFQRARYGDKFKAFNGREQGWLRDGESLVGPVASPREIAASPALAEKLKHAFSFYGNAVANAQPERVDEAINDFNALLAEASIQVEAAERRVPVAWQVRQGSRVFLVSAAEFTRASYDSGSFKPLFE